MRLRLEKILWSLLFLALPVQTAKHFWPGYSFVNNLPVDYLSPVISFTDILIFLLLIIKFPVLPKLNKFHLIIIFFVIINILSSISPLVTLYQYFHLAFYYVFFLRLTQSLKVSFHIMAEYLPLSAVWSVILALMQIVKQSSLGGFLPWLGERPLSLFSLNIAKISLGKLGIFLRPYATFPHPNAMAGYLLVTYFISLYFITVNKKSIVPQLGLVFSLAGILISFSRSVMVSLGLAFLIINIKNNRIIGILISSLALLSIIYFSINIGSQTSLTDRFYLLEKAFTIISSRPLLGIGLGNFSKFVYSPSPTGFYLEVQPVHNLILLFVSEIGLPFFIMAIILFWRAGIYNIFHSDICLQLSLMSVFLISLVDHYWFTSDSNLLLLILLFTLIKFDINNYAQKS